VTLPPLDAARARQLVARFAGVRVLVVGDAMLDRFIVGQVTRISPEAPVPVVQYRSEHVRLGGAANVASNATALGATVTLVAVVGADSAARRLREQLAAENIEASGLVEDPARPTVEKLRIVTERNQQVARVDFERDDDVSGDVERRVIEQVEACGESADVLLASDYLKGTLTRAVLQSLIARKTATRPLLVDPKVPHLESYRGATLVTPNQHEAETATHRVIRTEEDACRAGVDFRARAGCEAVLITRGEHGMWLSSPDVEGSVPAAAREVSDVTGAGDTVVATLALALAAGATLAEAAVLANHAAGLVVGKFGPASVTTTELLSRFSA
jgi:rfaE bifunctional protein kinase chain/domain